MITAGMLGQELDEVQDIDSVKDVIGEMTNILGGNLKAAFCDTGLDCQISTPSLTVGLDFSIEILNMDRYERFAFKLNDHDILVEVCVKIDEPEPIQSSAAQSQRGETDKPLDDDAIQKMIAAANQEGPKAGERTAKIDRPNSAEEDQPTQTLDGNAIQALLAAANSDKGADKNHDREIPTVPIDAMASVNEGDKATDNQSNDKPDSNIFENVSFIRDIPVHIVVELGRTKMNIKDILGIGKGSAIVLSNLEGETLDIRANNRLIAKGEVLVENDKYGIRIKEIVGAAERVGRLVI